MTAPFNFVSAGTNVCGIVSSTLYTVPTGKQAIIKSVICQNNKNDAVNVGLQLESSGNTYHIAQNVTLAARASSNVLAGTLVMTAGEILKINSNNNLHNFNNNVSTVGSIPGVPSGYIHDAIYANGLHVVVGDGYGLDPYDTLVMTSPDAITWTWRNANPNNATSVSIQRIAYGAGVFVAYGTKVGVPFIQTSPNGITWTERTQAITTGADSPDLIYAGGNFVATMQNATTSCIQTSTDGITWTLRTQSAAFLTYGVSIAYDATNAVYAISTGAGGGPAAAIVTSTNLSSWTTRSLQQSSCVGIMAIPGTIIAITDAVTTWARSADGGVSWTKFNPTSGFANVTNAQSPNHIRNVNGILMYNDVSHLVTSTDGLIWNKIPYMGPDAQQCLKLYYDGNNYFGVGTQKIGKKYGSMSTAGSTAASWTASVIEVDL